MITLVLDENEKELTKNIAMWYHKKDVTFKVFLIPEAVNHIWLRNH